jgi:hypothetical protein
MPIHIDSLNVVKLRKTSYLRHIFTGPQIYLPKNHFHRKHPGHPKHKELMRHSKRY